MDESQPESQSTGILDGLANGRETGGERNCILSTSFVLGLYGMYTIDGLDLMRQNAQIFASSNVQLIS